MKTFFAVLVLAAVAYADVSHLKHVHAGADATAQILRQDAEVEPDRSSFAVETSNGISIQEQGQLKNAGSDAEAWSVSGAASYTSPEGQPIQLTYTADENGFQPQGAHLPVAPAVPVLIARALEWIAAHPQVESQNQFRSQPIQVQPVQYQASAQAGFNGFRRFSINIYS